MGEDRVGQEGASHDKNEADDTLMCVVIATKKSSLTLCAVRFPRRQQ